MGVYFREAAMMHLITSENFGACVEEITEMHRLRYRVFKVRL